MDFASECGSKLSAHENYGVYLEALTYFQSIVNGYYLHSFTENKRKYERIIICLMEKYIHKRQRRNASMETRHAPPMTINKERGILDLIDDLIAIYSNDHDAKKEFIDFVSRREINMLS